MWRIFDVSGSGVCRRCAGRVYGKVGTGIDNAMRGSIIQFIFSLLWKEDLKFQDEDSCAICHGIFGRLDIYREMIMDASREYEFRTFLIGSRFDADIIQNEERFHSETYSESIKKEFNRELGKRLQSFSDREFDKDDPDIAFQLDTRYDSLKLQVKSLFIYGTYRKFRRDIPQTRWIYGGPEKSDSLEEIIGKKLSGLTGCSNYFLHGAGREDVDVRMLGNGREFIIEAWEPKKRSIDLGELKTMVNSSGSGIEISNLKFTSKRHVQELKASDYYKTYEALVQSPDAIDGHKLTGAAQKLTGKVIYQRTPLRVSGRRSDLTRHREVRETSVLGVDGFTARIQITAQAGTYIKELVSGDHGRTEPNLAHLYGSELTVRELDVIRIHRSEING